MLPWRGAATPRFIHAPTPSLPRRGRGMRGGVGEARQRVQEGEMNHGWVVLHGGACCAPYAQPHPPPTSKGQARSLLLLHGLWMCMTTRGDIAPIGGSTSLGSPTPAHHTPAQLGDRGPSTEFCTHASPACHSSHAWQPWPYPAEDRVPALNSGERCRIGAAPEALAQRHQRLNFCGTIALPALMTLWRPCRHLYILAACSTNLLPSPSAPLTCFSLAPLTATCT